jgi:hypothetical protein
MLTEQEIHRLMHPDFDRMKRESAERYAVALAVGKEARARGDGLFTVKEVAERAKCSEMGARFAILCLEQRGACVMDKAAMRRKDYGTYKFVARER